MVFRDTVTDHAALYSSGSAYDSRDRPAYSFTQTQYRYDTTIQKSARLREESSNHAAGQSPGVQQSATREDQRSYEPPSSVQSDQRPADISSRSPDMANRPHHAGSHHLASNTTTWEASNISDLYLPPYNVNDLHLPPYNVSEPSAAILALDTLRAPPSKLYSL